MEEPPDQVLDHARPKAAHPPPPGGYIMSRLFYEPVEAQLLYDLLDQICIKTDRYYVVNIIAFRKMKFLQLHLPFLNTIVSRYQVSKRYFVTRPLTFPSFVTILKQLCHHNRLKLTSSIQYSESEYVINYFVWFSRT